MSDIFDYKTTETHGHRVKDTFLTFAQSGHFTLFTLDGGSGTSFEAIHTNETVIISARISGIPLKLVTTVTQKTLRTNALYLSSLEIVD